MAPFNQAGLFLAQSGALPFLIFISILGTVKLGWHIGNRAHHQSNGTRTASDDTLISAILGLMALMIAFTFNGAANRLDQRERLIVAEANAISSAYVALSYIDAKDQPLLRSQFKSYLNQRISLYENILNTASFAQKRKEAEKTLGEIRNNALAAVQSASGQNRALANDLVRQVSSMSSAYDAQRQAMWFHPPRIIWISLILLVIIGSFLAGYKMGLAQRRERFLPMLFASLMSCAIFLIVSLEFPLLANLNLDAYNQEFITLRDAIPDVQPVAPNTEHPN